MYTMNGGGVRRDELQQALIAFNVERIAAEIELRVLGELVVGP
jgi:hypothetical protein